MATQLITIKVGYHTRQWLRILAAHLNKPMHQVADELAWAELKRLKLSPLKRATNDVKGKGEK
jgi:hypothetical protein